MTETAEKWTSFPITYKYIDVSTAHITEKDDKLLRDCMDGNSEDIAPAGHKKQGEGGYWIWVNRHCSWCEEAYEKSEFSPAFINLMERATHSDADWMNLDCDGQVYDDLPQHNW
jgi:hypothetical protein